MVDFHSHILPYIDDGAENVETSVSMIKLSKRQNVQTIIATPHFYPSKNTVATSLGRREAALKSLNEYASEVEFDLPEILLGFEVAVESKLKEIDISSLNLGNGKVMLLEMPYSEWTDETFEILEYVKSLGYIIIMAHVERFIGRVEDEKFERLINMGFYNQVNSNAFINPQLKDFVSEMIKEGFVHLIGSDAHNVTTRCSLFDVAFNFIKNKIGTKHYDFIIDNENFILNQIR